MLNELRTELASVVMDAMGEEGIYTFIDSSTKTISVRIYDDVTQFDDLGVIGSQVEVGIDINEIKKCHPNETVLVGGKTYTIHGYIRKSGNIKHYRVV